MLDNPLNALIITILNTGLAARSLSSILVKQKNQPTQQGANTLPTLYFFKITDYPYGFLKRTNEWDENSLTEVHKEQQTYLTSYQIDALAIQDPAATTGLTAADIVKTAKGILESDDARETFKQNDVQILKIRDIRNPVFKDDRNQFEASPSFDFTLSHSDTIISASQILQNINISSYRV